MKFVASAFILLCMTLISTVFANLCKEKDGCKRIVCTEKSVKCPLFDCGASKACNQVCVKRNCGEMNCNAKEECNQACINGQSKMICSSDNCTQTCDSGTCDLECKSSVKKCEQICSPGSKCKMTCKSGCQQVCRNATCTGLPEKPKTNSKCDAISGNCTISCTSGCKGNTISCSSKYKRCFLSCNGGCNMKCDKGVEECHQECIGDMPCTSECEAKRCPKVGMFHTSSAVISHLDHLVFAVIASMVLFNFMSI